MSPSIHRRVRPDAGSPAGTAVVPAALAVLLALTAGCGASRHGLLAPDERPTITISSGPIERGTTGYRVRVDWHADDADGYVAQVFYAADPPVEGDTAWVQARTNFATFTFTLSDTTVPPIGSPAVVFGYHTVVLKAVDNDGAFSQPVSRSFTATTVAPFTTITAPVPTVEVPITTTPSLVIQWRGVDPDGPPGGAPDHYAWLLARADSISPDNPNAVTAAMVQAFFGHDAATRYAGWGQLDGAVSQIEFRDLLPNTTYYFAIVAFDEAGAFEPRFSGNSNVLAFRPTLNILGPVITVYNAYFSRTQLAGGVVVTPSRIYPFVMPAGVALTFNWTAQSRTQGSFITGYRWALDLADTNVADSTARSGPDDVTHWSDWSMRVTQATVGPFAAGPGDPTDHLLYVEARDYVGFVSLVMLDLQVVTYQPTRPLLVVDDMYGAPTEFSPTPPYVAYKNPYPMEAEQDSFHYARGGYPDSLRILAGTPGAISTRGTFADFDYDTLDYGNYPQEGIAVADLFRYQVIAAYTDAASAVNSGAKFGSNRPATWLRLINSINRENTLALYSKLGGKLWLFGDGTTTAIANGYYSRITGTPPRYPYESGDDVRNDILRPGDFLYDFCHLRSELNQAGVGTPATANVPLHACLPYLPQYALPAGQPPPADRSLDPRVGPSAQRTLAHGWGSLPRLTLAAYRTANADPVQRFVTKTNIISQPLFVTEGAGAALESVADTLYLCQALQYDPNDVNVPASDGMPNAIDYYGGENGEVVWFGFPLYFFEPDQARQCAHTVLTHLGLVPAAPRASGAHVFLP